VGDDQQARARRGDPVEQQVDDLGPGGGVEVAGRLVGQQQLGRGRRGAGDGDALLLAARQLRRIMVLARGKADGGKLGPARSRGSGAPTSSIGTITFCSAVMVGSR
jgi:hypothetical protein